MKVGKDSLLFSGLTDGEAYALEGEVENCVQAGKTNFISPFFKEWCRVAGFDGRQLMLVYSTGYMLKAAYSLAEHYRKRAQDAEERLSAIPVEFDEEDDD